MVSQSATSMSPSAATHDSFSAYAAAFRPLLGLPGDGALEVFNQAIGVKELMTSTASCVGISWSPAMHFPSSRRH